MTINIKHLWNNVNFWSGVEFATSPGRHNDVVKLKTAAEAGTDVTLLPEFQRWLGHARNMDRTVARANGIAPEEPSVYCP